MTFRWRTPGGASRLALLLAASAMGLQSAAIRRLGQISTTYLTSILTALFTGLALRRKPEGTERSIGILLAAVQQRSGAEFSGEGVDGGSHPLRAVEGLRRRGRRGHRGRQRLQRDVGELPKPEGSILPIVRSVSVATWRCGSACHSRSPACSSSARLPGAEDLEQGGPRGEVVANPHGQPQHAVVLCGDGNQPPGADRHQHARRGGRHRAAPGGGRVRAAGGPARGPRAAISAGNSPGTWGLPCRTRPAMTRDGRPANGPTATRMPPGAMTRLIWARAHAGLLSWRHLSWNDIFSISRLYILIRGSASGHSRRQPGSTESFAAPGHGAHHDSRSGH